MKFSGKTTISNLRIKMSLILISFLSFFFTSYSLAQVGHHHFDFSTAAGIAFNSTRINSEGPRVIPIIESSFNFRLKDKRYIGLTYSHRNFSKTKNSTYSFFNNDIDLNFYTYRSLFTIQNFGVEFGQEFIEKLEFAVGLSIFVERENQLVKPHPLQTSPRSIDFMGKTFFDMNMTAGISYFFPINSYFNIGLRSKVFLSLSYGFENITITPVLRFSF